MNVKQILQELRETRGYDGLYLPDEDIDCGCLVDDLFLCDSDPGYCEAGKKRIKDDGDWEIVP